MGRAARQRRCAEDSSMAKVIAMPLFEYRCADCATDVEILVRGGEQPTCPDCGSRKLEKLFSATAAPVMAGASLPLAGGCPPPEMGPCSPHCCRLPPGG